MDSNELELKMIEQIANRRRQLKNLEGSNVRITFAHLLDIDDSFLDKDDVSYYADRCDYE